VKSKAKVSKQTQDQNEKIRTQAVIIKNWRIHHSQIMISLEHRN